MIQPDSGEGQERDRIGDVLGFADATDHCACSKTLLRRTPARKVLPVPVLSATSSLQLRALVTRIDQPKVLQHFRLAVGLDLRQIDRERRMMFFVHLNGPARTLKYDSGQPPG